MIGSMLGAALPFLFAALLVLLALKCFSIARRDGTNSKATVGLGLFILGLETTVLVGFATDGRVGADARLLRLGLANLGGVVNLVALVMCIWGVREIRRDRTSWTQGSKQGWWGIALACLWLPVISSNVFVSAAAFFPDTEPSPIERIATSRAEQVAIEELNFSITVPDGWQRLTSVEEISPDAAVGFLRTRPTVFFMIIAEELDVGLDTLTDIVAANVAAASESLERIDRSAASVGDLGGMQLEVDTVIDAQEFDHLYFVTVHNGFSYQLVAWSPSTPDREPFSTLAREAFHGFELIDLERIATPDRLAARESPYGYELTPPERWLEWPTLHDEIPSADFGGLTPEGAAFAVVPLALPHVPIADHDLVKALLLEVNVDLDTVAVDHRRTVSEEGVSGLDLEFTDTVDGSTYDNSVRFRRSANFAYLFAAWRDGDLQSESYQLEELLDEVVLFPDHEPRRGWAEAEERERSAHARLYTQLAAELFSRGSHDESIALLRESFALEPKAEETGLELLSALDQLGDYAGGMEFFEANGAALLESPAARSYQPYFLARLNRLGESAIAYRDLFATGWTSDHDFELYLDLLWQLGRHDQATEEATSYHERSPSVTAKVLLASAYRQQGDVESALALLGGDSPEDLPLNDRQAAELIAAHHDAGNHEAVIVLAEELVARSGDSATTLLLRAKSEFSLARFSDAQASLERALDLDPFLAEARTYLEKVRQALQAGQQTS